MWLRRTSYASIYYFSWEGTFCKVYFSLFISELGRGRGGNEFWPCRTFIFVMWLRCMIADSCRRLADRDLLPGRLYTHDWQPLPERAAQLFGGFRARATWSSDNPTGLSKVSLGPVSHCRFKNRSLMRFIRGSHCQICRFLKKKKNS